MNFEFATANRIVFGAGAALSISQFIDNQHRRVFLVSGKSASRFQQIVQPIEQLAEELVVFQVSGEPTVETVLHAVRRARDEKANIVVGLGGGSVLDTGKVVAALLSNEGDLTDYLEVIGRAEPIKNRPVPYIALPTTAGTGAEVTCNAVLKSEQHQVKVSMRHAWMIPDIAVIDPELTYSMPPEMTASTGLDALTQVIEPFVTHLNNPLTDAVCREGIHRAGRSLKHAYENGSNAQAREDMAIASLCGGMALANAKLGAVHGIAGPLGGMFPAPHGVVCARLLPFVVETNVRILRQQAIHPELLFRFDKLGMVLTQNPKACSKDAVDWIQTTCEALHVPPLSQFGLTKDAFPELIEKSQNASSMKGNPVKLSDEELWGILEKAI